MTTHSRSRADRGQILPIFAVMIGVILLAATVLIDGTFMFTAQRNLEVIAQSAARRGAIESTFNATACGLRGANANCSDLITLKASAQTQAEASARNWITQLAGNQLGLPNAAPVGSNQGVVAELGHPNASGVFVRGAPFTRVRVTVTRCYAPHLVNIFIGSNGGCTNAIPITATVVAGPEIGH
jgi:hypothetical protein